MCVRREPYMAILGFVSTNALRRMRASASIRAIPDAELVACHVVCVQRKGCAVRCFVESTHVTPALARRCLLRCTNDAVEISSIERAEMPTPPINGMVHGELRLVVHTAKRVRMALRGHTLWGVHRPTSGWAHFLAPSDMDISPVLACALAGEDGPLQFEMEDAAPPTLWTSGEGVCGHAKRFAFYRMACII